MKGASTQACLNLFSCLVSSLVLLFAKPADTVAVVNKLTKGWWS